jgi:hypothetical protein
METDGSCPNCGRRIADVPEAPEEPKVPWHFKLLLVGVCGYLGWRFVQLVQWLV